MPASQCFQCFLFFSRECQEWLSGALGALVVLIFHCSLLNIGFFESLEFTVAVHAWLFKILWAHFANGYTYVLFLLYTWLIVVPSLGSKDYSAVGLGCGTAVVIRDVWEFTAIGQKLIGFVLCPAFVLLGMVRGNTEEFLVPAKCFS